MLLPGRRFTTQLQLSFKIPGSRPGGAWLDIEAD